MIYKTVSTPVVFPTKNSTKKMASVTRNQQNKSLSSPVKQSDENNPDQLTNCLLLAVLKNNYEVTRFLAEEAAQNIDLERMVYAPEYEDWSCCMHRAGNYSASSQFRASILWYACRSSHLNIVKCLLQNGAGVNLASESRFNSTPLM